MATPMWGQSFNGMVGEESRAFAARERGQDAAGGTAIAP